MRNVSRLRVTIVIIVAAATMLFEVVRAHADERGNQLITCVRVIENGERVSPEQAGAYCANLKAWALEAISAGRRVEVDTKMRGLARQRKAKPEPRRKVERSIGDQLGYLCTDRAAAQNVSAQLRTGSGHVVLGEGCHEYAGRINFAAGTLENGVVSPVIRDPFADPRPAFFVPFNFVLGE